MRGLMAEILWACESGMVISQGFRVHFRGHKDKPKYLIANHF